MEGKKKDDSTETGIYWCKLHAGNELSPCVIFYRQGWSHSIYTTNTGYVWEKGKSEFYFKIPRDLSIGDEIQITARKGNTSHWKRAKLVQYRQRKKNKEPELSAFGFELVGSSIQRVEKKASLEQRIVELERRIEELERYIGMFQDLGKFAEYRQ